MISLKDKLVREVDGHKFYSKAYRTKEEAIANKRDSYHALYEGSYTEGEGHWYNYGGPGGNCYQEDIHERP